VRLALSESQWQLGNSGNSEFRFRFVFYSLNFPAKES